MPLTPAAKKAAEDALAEQTRSRKQQVTAQVGRIQQAFSPPLSNGELALGLGAAVTTVGRWVSTSPRSRWALPEPVEQLVLDRILRGDVFVAVGPAPMGGGRRSVVVCQPVEVARMGADYTVVNLAGKTVQTAGEDLEDAAAWDLFSLPSEPEPTPAPRATKRRKTPKKAVVTGGPLPPLGLSAAGERRRLGPFEIGPVGLGCMRLSTADRPDEETATSILHAALDAGVTLFDTADAYCQTAEEVHHNERLLSKLAGREGVVIATKCGLIRPGGRWLPNGRPEHLRAACEGSLAALGVDALDLVQLHAVDPKVPIEESMGALAELVVEGKIRHLGVCNVDEAQLDRALSAAPVEVVQLRISPFDKASVQRGMLARCHELGLGVIAHSPAGGYRKRSTTAVHDALRPTAEALGTDPHTLAVAWTLSLSPDLVAIPGATRVESITASATAARIAFSGAELARLDGHFAHGAQRIRPKERVRIVMGPPASGKTSAVQPLLDEGWSRLNRDEEGGKLDDLLPKLKARLEAGERVVLDNTYPTAKSRRGVLETARALGVGVDLVWLDTPKTDAGINAAKRILERTGRNLSPAEITAEAKTVPNCFPPPALDRWFAIFEEPSQAEGLSSVCRVTFARRWPTGGGRGLFLDLDGTVRETHGGPPFPRDASEVHLMKGRVEVLSTYVEQGWKLFGVSNQAGVALGQVSLEGVQAAADRTAELLGLPIDITFCPHRHRKVGCWCRKPLPGMGLRFLLEHGLNPADCLMVGDRDSDRAFAEGLGMPYQDEAAFFAQGSAGGD